MKRFTFNLILAGQILPNLLVDLASNTTGSRRDKLLRELRRRSRRRSRCRGKEAAKSRVCCSEIKTKGN